MKMKATGNVRKIDKTGRVVLPKEILRDLNIQKGDSLNVYICDRDKLILEKVQRDEKK